MIVARFKCSLRARGKHWKCFDNSDCVWCALVLNNLGSAVSSYNMAGNKNTLDGV